MTKSKKMLASILTAAMILTASAPVTYAAAPATRTSASSAAYVKSDTTMDFTVTQDQTYQFRFEIVGPRGLEPHIVAGNGNVLRTENVTKAVENGHDVYYFKVRAIGKPGQASAIYTTLPGQKSVKHCTIAVGAPYVKSDTTVDFAVKKNNTYQFRFEIVGPRGLQPNLVAGNGSVLQTEDVKQVVENGHDVYYFKVRAIGKSGEGSSIYTTLPGQASVKHCTIWVDTKPGATTPGGSSNPGGTSQPGGNQGGDTEKPGETTPGQDDETQVPLESITMSQTAMTMEEGSQKSLYVVYHPGYTTEDKTVTWISSNPSVATVDSRGLVTSYAAGTTTITAKVGTKSASCVVTVIPKATQGLLGTISPSWPTRSTSAAKNTDIVFNVTGAKTDGITFTSDFGLDIINTKKETSGTNTKYTITVRADNSGTYKLVGHADNNTTVTVNVAKLNISSLNGQNVTLDITDTVTLTYMLNPSGGNSIVTVDSEPRFTATNARISSYTKKKAANGSDKWEVLVAPELDKTSGSVTMQLGDASYTINLTYVNTQQKVVDAFRQYAADHNYPVTYDPSIAASQLLGYTTSKADVDASGMPDENSMYNLLQKMKDHGATKFAYTISPPESYSSDYFTYEVTKTVPAGTEPDWDSIYYSIKNTDFDNSRAEDSQRDKIGCNPYACRRLQEVTGINIGEIDIGVILNGQEYSRPWNDVKSYYESLGMKFGQTPKKHSILFVLAGNGSSTHVTHVAFVESDVYGISKQSPDGYFLSSGGNANPLVPGYYIQNEWASESDNRWFLYAE